jgi:predicted ATPase/DNA-binding NarL/FixJ family response regulator
MREDRPGGGTLQPRAGAPSGTVTPFPAAAGGRRRAAPAGRASVVRGRLAAPSHNLPLQLTSFVGRQQALAALRHLLATTRLLTLTGAPGVGKTRLALQLADEAREAYADGVWLVELAPLADPALVPQAVAAVLGVREHPGQRLAATLAEALRGQQVLLVLDNCEHLVEACAMLADTLLRTCPRLEILATSREAVGVAGETAWWVPSLAVPAETLPPSAAGVAALGECEAVQLFVERAGAVVPSFALTERNAEAVGQVCRRLDGIPLALELAAARVRALRVEQLAARLDDRFRLLTAGSRVALPRQQTLRAAVDWSHELLPEPERVLLRRLAVFAGGWTLRAAEAVCAGDGIAPEDVLELLVQLVNKSLVLVEEHGAETRYRLLETMRQYGGENLQAAGEEAAVRDRHWAWCMALARRAYGPLWGPDQKAWVSRLQTELDNLRAAVEWGKLALERDAGAASPVADATLDTGCTLWRFWRTRGHLHEARRSLMELLARAPAPTAARANALWAVGYLALLQGDVPAARSHLEDGLSLAREFGHTFGTIMTLGSLGAVATVQGDLERAARYLEESLPLLDEVPDEMDRYVATIASAYWRVELTRSQGNYGEASSLLKVALGVVRDRGDTWSIAFALSILGRLAWLQGEYSRATQLQRESLALQRELDDRVGIADSLDVLAWVASAAGEPARAARLFGAAEAVRERSGAASLPVWRAEHERNLAAMRAHLGAEAFETARAAGRSLTVEEAIEEALREGGSAPAAALPPAAASVVPAADPLSPRERSVAPAADPLSPREREVAALIARGLTNGEIADRLVISQWTADTHVRHILTKLDVRSRAQVATWAAERGLLASEPR